MGGRSRKKQRKELSQAEIWDDSALVQSWDDALAEYKKYHSIHARGERVEDAIKTFGDSGSYADITLESVSDPQADMIGGSAVDDHLEELEDGEVDEEEVEKSTDYAMNEILHDSSHEPTSHQALHGQPSSVPSFPANMADGAKNDGLKNLMMSWYYAGYYTGFFDGQKSATDNTAA